MVSVFRFAACLLSFAISSASVAQVFNFDDPVLLPFNINSEASETLPLLSSDGKLMYFARSLYDLNTGGMFAGHDIWVSERMATGWTRASNNYFRFNTKGNDAVIGTNKAGNVVYLMQSFPNKPVPGIYSSRRVKGEWGSPVLIPIEGLDTQGSLGFYMHPDEDVLLISMKATEGQGEEDLFISVKSADGSWSNPRNLGTAVNTSGAEISPYLSQDKRSLYFASTGHKGFGDFDIFVSYRLYDSWETWTVPKNLGEKVNSRKFDAFFSIYGDTLAYYASNKAGKHTDIYAMSVAVSDEDQHLATPLAEAEVSSLIGENVSRKVEFMERSTTLTATQRELLWYIATKLISQKDVRIMLIPSAEDDSELTSNRLNSIVAQLAGAGIEGSRIRRDDAVLSASNRKNYTPGKGEVRLVLFR